MIGKWRPIIRIGIGVGIWVGVLLMTACAGAPPEQVKKETVPTFDPGRYLTAQADGDTEAQAKQQAIGELAAVFESRVQAASKSHIQSVFSDPGPGDGAAAETFGKQVEQLVQIDTDVRLKGIQIGWSGPVEGGGYRAIAILDRNRAAQRWYNDLERIRLEIDADRKALDATKGRLPRLAALNHMTVLMARMTVIEGRLSVIGRPVEPLDPELADLLTERARLSAHVAFQIEIEGEPAQAFTYRLAADLTREGFAVTDSADQAAGRLSGRVWLIPLDLKNPKIRFHRALAEITLTDLDTNLQVAAFSENLRKGHVDENEAKRLAVDELADKVAQKITQTLATLGEDSTR